MAYVLRAGKLISASEIIGTILDAAIVVQDGNIISVSRWDQLKPHFHELPLIDYQDYVVCPGLVDCHTHLLEFAPGSLHPITQETQLMGGIATLLHTLESGVTAVGEQICGHPLSNWTPTDYFAAVTNLPIDITFSLSSISIGFDPVIHFSAVTGPNPLAKETLIDHEVIYELMKGSGYPGENVFINATPANFSEKLVPNAGVIIYSQSELNDIVHLFHSNGKKIGAHVGGKEAIDMALEAGIDVLHHAHAITDSQISKAKEELNCAIVATPIGGTHALPNSPENIAKLVTRGILTAISTDAYLPPHPKADWLPFKDNELKGPESLMAVAHPSMKLLIDLGLDENIVLSLITKNPAVILGKGEKFGSIETGKEANFLVCTGVPGIEITDVKDIRAVWYRGKKVIERANK